MIAVIVLLLLQQVTPEAAQHISAGMKAKAAGDLDGAIREFTRVAELVPELAAVHVNLGAVYVAKKDYAAAIPALRKALTLNADLPGAHGMLGTSLIAQGFGCEAVPHLEKGGPEDLLGVALLDCGRAREALDRLEAALEKRANDPDLLYYVGQAHGQLAKQAFDALRAANPDAPRTHQAMGEALAAMGNRTGAEAHFRAALAARPDMHGAHYALGELLVAAGDYEKAEAEFREESRLAPGSAAAAFKLGSVLANRGRTAEAIGELKRANKLRPGMPETLVELGKALNASGDAKSAERYLREALVAEDGTALAETAHFQLSQAYRKLGRAAEADRELKAFQALKARRGK